MNGGYFFNFEKLAYVKGEKPAGCIFCMIRDRNPEIIDLSVYRDEFFAVSVNLYPYNPGHLLIFPLRHIEDIRDYSPRENRRLEELLRYFLDLSDQSYSPQGYNIGYNMGTPAGGSIAHLHLHLIPRYHRELGIADLIAGKRVLVEDPRETARKLKGKIAQAPFSNAIS